MAKNLDGLSMKLSIANHERPGNYHAATTALEYLARPDNGMVDAALNTLPARSRDQITQHHMREAIRAAIEHVNKRG